MLFLFSLVDTDHMVSDYKFHSRVSCCFSTSKKGDAALSNFDPSRVSVRSFAFRHAHL